MAAVAIVDNYSYGYDISYAPGTPMLYDMTINI